jgi:hypothetical protein
LFLKQNVANFKMPYLSLGCLQLIVNHSKTPMKNTHPNVMICLYNNNNNNVSFHDKPKVAHPLPPAVAVAPSHLQVETSGGGRFFESLKEPSIPGSLNDFVIKEPSVLVL